MGTTSTYFGGSGGGGDPQANFKAGSNISANDLVALQNNGTIVPISSTATSNAYGSLNQSGTTGNSNTLGHSYFNYTTNTLVHIYDKSGTYRVRAATNSNGTLTWGSEVSTGISSNQDVPSRVTYDSEHDYYIAWGCSSSNSLYCRSFSVSGNTITMVSASTFVYYYYWEALDALYLPDIGTHVCAGAAKSQNAKMINVTLDSSGAVSSNYFNASSPPNACDTAAASGNISCAIADLGGGTVAYVRDSSNTANNRAFAYASVSQDEVSFNSIVNAISLGYNGSLPVLLADKAAKMIFYGNTQGSSTSRFTVLSYKDFLGKTSTTLTMGTISTQDGYMTGASNQLGDMFLHFAQGSVNYVRTFRIEEGYMSGIVKVTGPTGTTNVQGSNSNISAAPYDLEVWSYGLNVSSDSPQARNWTFTGVNTNKNGFIGTAPEAITSGSVGSVNLINRDVTQAGLKSGQVFVNGQKYYENSSGSTLATSGSNLVGYGNDGSIKVIGASS